MGKPKPPREWEQWSHAQRESWVSANSCRGKGCLNLYEVTVNGLRLCRRCQIEFMNKNQRLFGRNEPIK